MKELSEVRMDHEVDVFEVGVFFEEEVGCLEGASQGRDEDSLDGREGLGEGRSLGTLTLAYVRQGTVQQLLVHY